MIKRHSYEIAYITDKGNVREKNQDSLLIRRGSINDKEIILIAVADGMGGLSKGEEASACAVSMLDQWWLTVLPAILEMDFLVKDINESLIWLIDEINWRLYSKYRLNDEKVGTTLSLALIYQGEYEIFQVGDSRAYLSKRKQFVQLTRDQTWCQKEIEAGHLTREEAAVHPMSHVLISTLGVTTNYTLEKLTGNLKSDEGILLCSDGFYTMISLESINSDLLNTPLQRILDAMKVKILQGKAIDNLTAVWVRS